MKKYNKLINIMLCLIFIIQPLLELIYLNNLPELLSLQISTFIRLVLFGILSIFIIINFKNLKYIKTFIIYLLIIFIYFILHHINAINFTSFDPNDFNYNLFSELSYLLRLLIPIFLIYYVLNSKLESKHLKISISIITVVICLVIIISNIFKFSICSYGYGPILGNIFDWFLNPGENNYIYLASRGLFNHITIFYIIILTSPYIINHFIKSNSKKEYIFYGFLIFISLVTAFMVGTKATTLGYIIVLIIMFILNIFFSIIKKEYKISWFKIIYLLSLIIISIVVIPYSPMSNRNNVDAMLEEEKINSEEENTNIINMVNIEDVKDYLTEKILKTIKIENNYVNIDEVLSYIEDEEIKKTILINTIQSKYMYYGITEKFIEKSYPYNIDPYFWKDYVDNTEYYERSNNRKLVETIYKRVIEINNNKYDKLLGISYSRTSNIFNLERDFLYQTYSMGIVGSILILGPYILFIILIGTKMLMKYKKSCNLKNCSIILGIGLTLCLALYSGNTIDSLSVMMPLGILLGYLTKQNINN